MTSLLLLPLLSFSLRIGFLFYRKQELRYVATFIQSARRKKYKISALGIRIRILRSSGCGSGRPKNIQIRRDTDPDGIRKTGTFTSLFKVIKKVIKQ
jgi:hypothetical protein